MYIKGAYYTGLIDMAKITEKDIYRRFYQVAKEFGYETKGQLITVDGVRGYKYPFLVIEQDLNGLWSMWIVGASTHPDCKLVQGTSYHDFGGCNEGMTTDEFYYYLKGILIGKREYTRNEH